MNSEEHRRARPAGNTSGPRSGGHVSPERLSEIIGDIYDCVLDPTKWEQTVAGIVREFSCAGGALALMQLRPEAHSVNVMIGGDPEWTDYVAAHPAEALAMWGGAEAVEQFPLDEPIIGTQVPAFADRHDNPYFRDVLEPRGMVYGTIMIVARQRSLHGYAGFPRHRSQGEFTESEIGALRVLAPHIRRAATISDLFDLKTIEAATLGSAIDGLACGVVLVDENLAAVHANTAAQAMLAARAPIRSANGKMVLAIADSQAALERTVRQVAIDEAGLGAQGIGIPARHMDGEPCVIHVLPLERSEIRRRLARPAVAALFITPAAAPPVPSGAIALLYDLTPAETRIFELMSTGKTQAEISQALGIAASTVKTHTLHLFEKTGCRRQAELVRLAARLTLPGWGGGAS